MRMWSQEQRIRAFALAAFRFSQHTRAMRAHCFFSVVSACLKGSGARALRANGTALLLALSFCLAGPQTLHAQQDSAPVPYDATLLRLAEVMGALHSLRPLCGNQDEPSWRERMIALLDVETAPGNRRRRFIARFNQGYRGFSSTYQSCTPAARLAMKQYVSEGEALIRNVTARFSR